MKQRTPENQELYREAMAFADRTSLFQASRHYGIAYHVLRKWAYRRRKVERALVAAEEANAMHEPLNIPDDPSTPIDVEGVAEPTWTPLEQRLPPKVELVARSVDTEAADALLALFTRIKNSAATAPMKEVISATRVVGELILAANVTNQTLARRLTAAATGLEDDG